jgi:hypothetical protein
MAIKSVKHEANASEFVDIAVSRLIAFENGEVTPSYFS